MANHDAALLEQCRDWLRFIESIRAMWNPVSRDEVAAMEKQTIALEVALRKRLKHDSDFSSLISLRKALRDLLGVCDSVIDIETMLVSRYFNSSIGDVLAAIGHIEAQATLEPEAAPDGPEPAAAPEGIADAAGGPEPAATPEAPPVGIEERAIAAAYALFKEGKRVSIKAACERAKVNRSHLANRYPEARKIIEGIAARTRVPRRGSKARDGRIEAVDNGEE